MNQSLEKRKQEMYGLIDRWRASSLSQKEFCKQEKISHHAFRYYVTKKNAEHPPESALPKFMPVTLDEEDALHEVKITYPNSVSIHVTHSMTIEFLHTLIHLY